MRPQGRGTERKDGRWAVSVTLDDGKRRFLYGASLKEAQAKANVLRRAIEDGEVPDRRTVAEFLAEWLAASKQRVRPSTYRRYEQQIRLQALPALGKLRLAELTARHLQKLYGQLVAGGASPTSVLHLHTNLHHALGQARRWHLVRENVAELVDPPRVTRYEAATLTAAQARALLAELAHDPLVAIWTLALSTGMRQGEILGLRWQDVDLEHSRLSVRGSLGRGESGRLERAETKTRSSTHTVLLTDQAAAALAARRELQRAERLLTGSAVAEGDLVFTTADGAPVASPWLLRRRHYPALRRAGLPPVRFHDLRHTVATLLLEQGVATPVVSDLLGHANTAITADVYSHVTGTLQTEAIAVLSRLLSPPEDVKVSVSVPDGDGEVTRK